MAQSIDTLQKQQMDYLVAALAALGFTLDPTQLADEDYRQLFTYIMAVGMGAEQQLWDAYMADVEVLAAQSPPQTRPWFQKRMLAFQYNSGDPQVLVVDETNVTYDYPAIVPADNVIKFCSVVSGALGVTDIKIADASSSAMSSSVISAAQSYADILGVPGMKYVVSSFDADRILIAATINYRGEYSAVISQSVIDAILLYLQLIPFNGIVDLTDLTVIIRAVPGVVSVVFNNIQARAAATSFGGGTNLVSTNTVIQNEWQTVAGKIIGEDTPTQQLQDTLTFIAQ